MLNSFDLQGRIGADLELQSTPGGKSVLSFPIAVDRDFKDKDGQRQTDWFTVVAWAGLAEHIKDCFSKGDMIILHGRLQSRTWQNQEGKNVKFVEIIAENAYFAGGKRSGGSSESSNGFVNMESADTDWDNI